MTGVSGTGVVVWGIAFPDGRCAYRWNTPTATTSVADCVADVETIHGHDGKTKLLWLDSALSAERWERHVGIGKTTEQPVWRGAAEGAAAGGGSAP